MNRVTTKNQRTLLSATSIGIIVATAVLLAFIIVPELIPSQVSAQIIPALNPDTSNAGIGSMAQDLADPVQNGTSANITQLATIPVAASPITPSTFTPLNEETGDSGDSSSNYDDDESDSGSDNESDDSDDDNDDGDGGSSASASAGGGAFAFAG